MKKNIYKFLVCGIISAMAFFSTALADYDEAKAAYDARDFDKAFDGFTQAAEEGHMMAQYYLGVMYATGRTVERDDVSAYKWFMQAALQGHPIAQGNIGTMKLNARGTEEDVKGAHFWFAISEAGGFEKSRKFKWRMTNFMTRSEIQASEARAEAWIENNIKK